MPVYLLQGDYEFAARKGLDFDRFNALQARRKQLFTFADAGHATAFAEFQPLRGILLNTILPRTDSGR